MTRKPYLNPLWTWVYFVLILVFVGACRLPSKPSGLVFASASSGNWELYFLADGSDLAQPEPFNLTRYPSSDRYPDLSPTGEDLVFASDRAGVFNLYLVDLAGKNLRLLSESPFPDTTPRWSPNGKQIVFVSERSERNENLYLIDPQTRAVRQLTTDLAADYDPAWSPDSESLVFISERSGAANLYRYDLNSGQTSALTQSKTEKRSPDLSPDGKTVCFAERQASGAWQLVLQQLETGERQVITQEQKWVGVPRWKHPSELIYSHYQKGRFALSTWDARSSESRPLLKAEDNREAVWLQ